MKKLYWCCAVVVMAGVGLFGALRVPPAAVAGVAHSARLCHAAPGLIARQQAIALQPRFRPLLRRLGAATYYRLSLVPQPTDKMIAIEEAFCYTNTTGDPLTTLALRLYGNYPVDNQFRLAHSTVNGVPATVALDPRDPTFALLTLPAPMVSGQAMEVRMTLTGHLPVATAAAMPPAMQFQDGGALGQFPQYLNLAWTYAQVGVYTAHRWSHTALTRHVDLLFAPIAFFDATLTLPRSYRLVSSGITLSAVPTGKAERTFHVVTGPVRDLTLEASPELAQVTVQAGPIRIESAYLPTPTGSAAATARLYAGWARTALTLANHLFTSYPYVKLTLAEAPVGAKALQWSTLIQMQANPYLVPHPWSPPAWPGVTLSSSQGSLIAHEVSHQWWYGLVGNDQVDNGFLSEGLATLSELFLAVEQTRQIHPRLAAQAWQELRQNLRTAVLTTYWAAGGHDVVIDQPASATPYGDPSYANYAKSAAFFALYADRFGQQALTTFLRRYAEQNQFDLATLATLQRALSDAVPGHAEAVAQMVTQWFRRPGLAQVIDPHAMVAVPAPSWFPLLLTRVQRGVPGLRPVPLRPEVMIQLNFGPNPLSAAVRALHTPQTPPAAITAVLATLRREGWAPLSPPALAQGYAQVQCRRGSHLLALIAVAQASLGPDQQQLLRADLAPGQTLLLVTAGELPA